MFWKLALAIVAVGGICGAALYVGGVTPASVKEAVRRWERAAISLEGPSKHSDTASVSVPLKENAPWDGLVTLTPDEMKAIGLEVADVDAQVRPIKLELTGRTAYDPDTLTKIRPRFDTLVEKVFAARGQKVKKGDPLVELHSTELAAAKSDFQSKYVQWQHDLNLYSVRKELVKTGAISKQLWVDTQNEEKKSRLEYTLARDKLKIFKVPDEDVEPLVAPLGGSAPARRNYGLVEDKARMTLFSPIDGIVIEREVVPQNFYETSTVLMVIAPLDHLWVLVNVYERDQDKVSVGQTMEIEFPFLKETIRGKVQYVANEVSKETHAVNVRASIPNPGARLKSDMLVKAKLEIPPVEGQTVVPRQAMVTINGDEYVFVRSPVPGRGAAVKFERREIVVAQENHDEVIVARGLRPGEVVATTGSLLLAQIDQDAKIVATGAAVE